MNLFWHGDNGGKKIFSPWSLCTYQVSVKNTVRETVKLKLCNGSTVQNTQAVSLSACIGTLWVGVCGLVSMFNLAGSPTKFPELLLNLPLAEWFPMKINSCKCRDGYLEMEIICFWHYNPRISAGFWKLWFKETNLFLPWCTFLCTHTSPS